MWQARKDKMKKLARGKCSSEHRFCGALFTAPARMLALALALALCCPAAHSSSKFEQLSQDGETAYKNRNYPEAEKLFTAAVKEATEKLEKGDKRLGTTVYNLALVFQAEGNYGEAEKNMLRALELTSYFYGPEHQRVARVYMDIADLYVEQSGQEGKPELKKKAAENYQKGIEIFEKIYSQASGEETEPDKKVGAARTDGSKPDGSKPDGSKPDGSKPNPQEAASDLANALWVLADTYAEDELYKEAEPLYKRSLELEDFANGSDSKEMSRHKAKLAEMYCVQAKYKDADPLFKDALALSEKLNGVDSQETGHILYNYGGLHYDQGEFGEAEIKFKRALKIFARAPNPDELDLAQKNVSLADVLDMQGKAEESQAIYKQIMPTFEKGEDKTAFIRFLKQYQKHLLMQNKKEEAGKVAARIKEIKAGLAKPSAAEKTP
jgi:Tfp pilus assembly protein PilF